MSLTLAHSMRNGDHYVGWEDASRQPGLYAFESLYGILAVVWLARTCLTGLLGRCCPGQRCAGAGARAAAAGGMLHVRMFNILLGKIVELSWQQAYWTKMDRGDARAAFAQEMRGGSLALEIFSQGVVFEVILLISVGWKITQTTLSRRGWNIVYGPLLLFMASGVLSGVAVGMKIPLLQVVAILLYISTTFYVYYIICYGASANIAALMDQMRMIRQMRIDPRTTPSFAKMTMFKNFRVWMAVYVSADLVLTVVQAALSGQDSNEQYEGALAIVSNAVEFLCAVSLFYVFWPGRGDDAYFRPIAVAQGQAVVPPLPGDDDDDDDMFLAAGGGAAPMPEAVGAVETVEGSMPITSNVVLAEWQPNQALPAILVGTVIGGPGDMLTTRGRRGGAGGGGGLTEVHPITGRTMSFAGSDDAGLHVQMATTTIIGAGGGGNNREEEEEEEGPLYNDNNTF